MASGREVAVVGGGWAGLAAAVEAVRQGHRVTLFEMARQFGGRAREVAVDGLALDNGQHICIGAYRETLRLLRTIGVAEESVFLRAPLQLPYADGPGLALGAGPPLAAFVAAVFRHPAWRIAVKTALARTALGWWLGGFRCDPGRTVAELAEALPAAVRSELIDPLCVAALNTPSCDASAAVFLRVLHDALFSGKGSADLLLPKASLDDLLPRPATRWLASNGATLRSGHRVESVARRGNGWSVDGLAFDGVVLAASSQEAARLARPHDPAWAERAESLDYEPIVTAYLRSPGARLPSPMLALRPDPDGGDGAPAQFVFDRGQLGGPAGLLAFVVSGAAGWVARGADATLEAVRRQALAALGPVLTGPLETVKVLTEKRATFRCTPGLSRPGLEIATGLVAAGDHVESPYPATLEGAVRSGIAAALALSG